MTIPAPSLMTRPDCPAVADPDTKVVKHYDACPVARSDARPRSPGTGAGSPPTPAELIGVAAGLDREETP